MVDGLVLRGATCRCRSASLSLGRELESPEVRLCTGGLVGSKMSVQVLRAVSTAALVLYLGREHQSLEVSRCAGSLVGSKTVRAGRELCQRQSGPPGCR